MYVDCRTPFWYLKTKSFKQFIISVEMSDYKLFDRVFFKTKNIVFYLWYTAATGTREHVMRRNG